MWHDDADRTAVFPLSGTGAAIRFRESFSKGSQPAALLDAISQ